MNTKDYISILAIERLLEDESLPEDLRMQARDVLTEILETNKESLFAQLIKGE